MLWLAAILIGGGVFSATTVQVLRRFGTNRWPMAAGIGAVLLTPAGGVMVLLTSPSLGNGFAMFLVAVGAGGGSLASGVAIAKLVKAVIIPDPIVETALGTAAFLGGVVASIILFSFLIGSMMPRIT
jgi:hypothetical protein